jgi:hypothetical protein
MSVSPIFTYLSLQECQGDCFRTFSLCNARRPIIQLREIASNHKERYSRNRKHIIIFHFNMCSRTRRGGKRTQNLHRIFIFSIACTSLKVLRSIRIQLYQLPISFRFLSLACRLPCTRSVLDDRLASPALAVTVAQRFHLAEEVDE